MPAIPFACLCQPHHLPAYASHTICLPMPATPFACLCQPHHLPAYASHTICLPMPATPFACLCQPHHLPAYASIPFFCLCQPHHLPDYASHTIWLSYLDLLERRHLWIGVSDQWTWPRCCYWFVCCNGVKEGKIRLSFLVKWTDVAQLLYGQENCDIFKTFCLVSWLYDLLST